MIIIGAGLSGLLAAKKLSRHNPTIWEKQPHLPNNHSALLRFRSDVVSKAIGIPFKPVHVYKGVLLEDGRTITNNPTIREYNAYSLKSTGYAIERSIINTDNARRFIAPSDLISCLNDQATIQYQCDFRDHFNASSINAYPPIISTIPMPELMDILGYPNIPLFNTIPIWTINCILDSVNIYQTLYVPYDYSEPYRVSITGNKMTLEFSEDLEDAPEYYINKYLDRMFGDHDTGYSDENMRKQEYGKIVPIDNNERQKFILWATDRHNIYSLGRFATWRQILLDDVIKDIDVIAKFIHQRSGYERSMHYQQETD